MAKMESDGTASGLGLLFFIVLGFVLVGHIVTTKQ